MDQALKARLIGAAVLVAVAVLLVPELLSGRKPAGSDEGVPAASHGTRTFTIELGGGTTQVSTPTPATASSASPVQAATADAAPQATMPATGTAAGSPSATSPAITTVMPGAPATTVAAPPVAPGSAAPRPAPAAAASTPTPPAERPATSSPARGSWAVQVGAFGSAATAAKLVDQLKSAGYRAYISPVSRSGKTLSRVRVGPEAERARAEGLAASLKARGLPATVVAND